MGEGERQVPLAGGQRFFANLFRYLRRWRVDRHTRSLNSASTGVQLASFSLHKSKMRGLPTSNSQRPTREKACYYRTTISFPPPLGGDGLYFQGSSFCRILFTAQSYVLNRPPQTPKLPPNTGARALIAVTAPIVRIPYGKRTSTPRQQRCFTRTKSRCAG